MSEDIKKTVLSLVKTEEESLKEPEAEKGIDYKFLQECFRMNEMGDGTYFAHLHQGVYIYAKKLDCWLFFNGQHWEIDHMERVYHGVEEVVKAYLSYSDHLAAMIKEEKTKEEPSSKKISDLSKEKEAYHKRVSLLRATNRPEACLRWSHRIRHNPLAITGDELDNQPWLLACRNGVIDLRTGKLRKGKPEDYITKAINIEWEGIDARADEWDKTLRDIFEAPTDLEEQVKEYPALRPYLDDAKQYTEDLVSAFRRAMGYSITGLSIHHFFMVLTGTGRNGKSLIIETLNKILDPLSGVIPSEMLLDQGRARSSSGPSPDIMLLKGLRLAIASETDENRRFSPGMVKWISGADSLTGRDLHEGYVTFKPSHTLALLTNHLPHAPAEDFAFWERLKLFPFNWVYKTTPEPGKNQKRMDPDLPGKLAKEASGILAWLVRGCLEYQAQGLNWPLVVQVATEKYRANEDLIGQFIEDCGDTDVQDNHRTPFKSAYTAFTNWYLSTRGSERTLIQKKKFSDLMQKRFRRDKIGGEVYFYGVSIEDPGQDG